jgi:RTA1 like protein
VAELSEGFGGALANDQVTFMILDGAMMVVVVIVLTSTHPGLTFGSRWDEGAFWSKKKNSHGSKEFSGTGSSTPDRVTV